MDAAKLRIVFVGMSRFFTRPVLRAVAKRSMLVGIVESAPAEFQETQVAQPPSLMRQFAQHRGLPHFLLRRNGARATQFIQDLHPDVICVACSALLLKREEFAMAPLGAINLHPSLLPRYRGPNPYFWQFHEMDLQGGVSVHQVDDGIDTGDILRQETFAIRPGESFQSVFQRSLQAGSAAMVRILEDLAAGQTVPRPQRRLLCPVYARFVAPGERLIDWERWPIQRVWHFLRGTHQTHPCLPPPAQAGGEWSIGEMEQGSFAGEAATLGRDDRGDFIRHRQGRIRLTLRPPRRVYNLLLPPARRLRRTIEWW